MLDLFIVFSKSGLVLFKQELVTLKNDPIDSLIKTVLLEGRSTTEQQFVQGQYAVKYLVNNKFELVFAAVYQNRLAPRYVDELLELVSGSFTKTFKEEIADASGPLEFDEKYNKLVLQAEATSMDRRRGARKNASSPKSKAEESKDQDGNTDDEDDKSETLSESDLPFLKRERKGGKSTKASSTDSDSKKKQPSTKAPRVWGDKKKLTKEEEEALDVTGAFTNVSEEEKMKMEQKKSQIYMPEEGDETPDIDKSDSEDDDDDGGWGFGKLGDFFSSLTGQKPLTREELDPSIDKLRENLMQKNVSTIATKEICEAVATDLEGKKLGSFTKGIGTAVKEACHKALSRLLTPGISTDILREVKAKKDKPYAIVFLGVNGVGKSTSLSKVAYYLKQNGLKVMLCACDTFRSGAVEQLQVHARNLDIPLFEQGYNKDAASVATNGIKHAKDENVDVILIDTAGRMQNNEPLMRSLTKLVAKNRPDLVLFVGEALVGNDGTDQLVHFDKALRTFAETAEPRTIDGMILTKFDTIDDKVGAAVSMVHSTGKPIVFVGTGQKYTNLNKLNVSKVVKSLLS